MLKPLQPLAAAESLVSSVTNVVDRLRGKPSSATFAQTLDELGPNGAEKLSPELTIQEITDAISQWFGESSFADNAPGQLELDQQGRLRVIGDHPAAASIEDALANDPQLQRSLQKIVAGGEIQPPQRLVLTAGENPANIDNVAAAEIFDSAGPRPGGYANW